MTKAERIFKDTYTECRIHAKAWGKQYNPDGSAVGFSGLITEEVTCKRTWNAIQKRIESEKKVLEFDKKYGILDKERLDLLEYAIEMVQSTLNNEMKKWAV